MTSPELPDLYFRLRENGATVFRLDRAPPRRRLEMTQIAVVNLRNGAIRPKPGAAPSAAETAAIETWIAARRDTLDRRRLDEVHRTVERLNLTAHWAQTAAAPEDLEAVADRLLMAMHDLRQVLVRRRADIAGDGAGGN